MITELTDTLDQLNQCRRRAGHLVGDNVYVSPSLVAKAAFMCATAKPLRSNRMPRKLASSREIAFSESRKRPSRAQATEIARGCRRIQETTRETAGLFKLSRYSLNYCASESPSRHVRYCEDVQS